MEFKRKGGNINEVESCNTCFFSIGHTVFVRCGRESFGRLNYVPMVSEEWHGLFARFRGEYVGY